MENSKNYKLIDRDLGIQDYLYIGYAVLLILGLFHDTIFYSFLGINILEYSSVLDVLISPISLLTGNVILLISIGLIIGFGILYVKFSPIYYKKLAKKEKYQSGKKKEKLDKSLKSILGLTNQIKFILVYLFSIYLGLSVGSGAKTKSLLQKKELKLTHKLVFNNGEKETIKMIGKNSSYVFYVTDKERGIICSPIEGNIKKITKLKEKE